MQATLLKQLVAQADRHGIVQLVVGAVVHDANRVLVLQRPETDFMGGIAELPSGKVEPGESLDAALLREVNEETGLDVATIDDYLGYFDYLSGSGKMSRQFNFAVSVHATQPVQLSEHDAYQWVATGDEVPVTDAVKDVLRRFRSR